MTHNVQASTPRFAMAGFVLALSLFVASCGAEGAADQAGGAALTDEVASVQRSPAPLEYPPTSWMAKIEPPASGAAVDIACLDRNADARINGDDGAAYSALDIQLSRGACDLVGNRREWFVDDGALSGVCGPSDPAPLLVVAIAGGGTQLLDRDEGVSAGLIDIVNDVRAANAASPQGLILMTSAIESADLPQTRMEAWLANDLRRRLDELPCLRVVLVGHSHGAVVATSVMAALEDTYADRLLGVVIDRSLLYYDREATEMPHEAALLNVFQTNDGWHGEPIDALNVTNIDMSSEVAPREPREGPLPIVTVKHSTLDDSPAVRDWITTAISEWVQAQPELAR